MKGAENGYFIGLTCYSFEDNASQGCHLAALSVEEGFSVGFGLAIGLAMGNYMLFAFRPAGRQVAQVLICLKCGGKNSVENKFCWHCGHPFYQRLTVKCPKCDSMMPSDANFCMNCRTRLKEK
jgi:ribosomal protein L40E